MIISPPRLNLRRAASYNHADRGPLSSTSSRFSFNHLLFSPPPSPGLPALTRRPRKQSVSNFVRPSRVLRVLAWILCLLFLYYLSRLTVIRRPVVRVLPWTHHAHHEYEMVEVEEENLPDFPTPIAVTDKRGRAKWTISIPPSYDFPLSIEQYSDLTAQCKEVSGRIQGLHSNHNLPQTILGTFASPDSQDRHFVDVKEAQRDGLLTGWAVKLSKVGKHGSEGNIIGESKDSLPDKQPICQKSMTFILESADAGLGKTMMQLWTAYGLALNEGRSFFIDDSRWAYGKYTDIFLPPPSPGCRAPPRHEMIPCPRQARHLVVSAATAGEIFSPSEPAISETTAEISAKKTSFALARQGYEALFHLNPEDSTYVSSRVSELTARRTVPNGLQNGLAIGLHIRRGDRHPLEYQYRDSYIPTNTYTERAREILETAFNTTSRHGTEDRLAKSHSFLLLASDDPTVYESQDFLPPSIPLLRAQDRIKLASKAAIHQAHGEETDRAVMRKFVDETFGWEGGFFAPMFRNLGVGGGKRASAETMRLRSLIGRAYVMDLAVLGRSDVVVCTVSAVGCRVLGVMMGWEEGMEGGGWVNVDGGFGWAGVDF